VMCQYGGAGFPVPESLRRGSGTEDSVLVGSSNFQGMIVVNQTSKVHERICNLLTQLRVALKQKRGE
jgi:hypothetical protein